jgi:hypothetical protein
MNIFGKMKKANQTAWPLPDSEAMTAVAAIEIDLMVGVADEIIADQEDNIIFY